MEWILMAVSAAGFGAIAVLHRRLARRSRLLAGLVAALTFALLASTVWWVVLHRDAESAPTEARSHDLPPGVHVDRSSGIRVTTLHQGLTLVLGDGQRALPLLRVRTFATPSDAAPEERFRDTIRQHGGTTTGGFRSAPLPIAPSARGVPWRTADREIFSWLVVRAPRVWTMFQCAAPLGGDPEHACSDLMAAVSLDPTVPQPM